MVGPPWSKRENGFVISENVDGGMRLYYEPHCDYDDGSVSSIGLVDAIITPASTQLIGGVFPLVGHNENPLPCSAPLLLVSSCFPPAERCSPVVQYSCTHGPFQQGWAGWPHHLRSFVSCFVLSIPDDNPPFPFLAASLLFLCFLTSASA